MIRLRRLTIPEGEEERLSKSLSLSLPPHIVKRALQDLCVYYERGYFLYDKAEVRSGIRAQLASPDVLVRRWALKALGFVADQEDSRRIVERLRLESDQEAVTWGVAALIHQAGERGLKEICVEAGLDVDTPILLASRLYAPTTWIEQNAGAVRVSLTNDTLTLNWAIFLAGYNRAPEDMFSPRHPNAPFLGELNWHDDALVAERSLWALWERKDLSYLDCRIRVGDALKFPPNVRKWLYQLAAQSPDASRLDQDFALDLLAKERDDSAREGLVKGLVASPDGRFDGALVHWYYDETNEDTKDGMLNGLAARSTPTSDAGDLVMAAFRRLEFTSPKRTRLLVAAQRAPILRDLQAIDERDSTAARPSMFVEKIDVKMEVNVVTNNTITAGRDINAQNIVGGDMIDVANNAVQRIGDDRAQDKEILAQVMQFLKDTQLPNATRQSIYEAVNAVAVEPKKENRVGLLTKLSDIAKAATTVGATITGMDTLIEHVGHWVG